MIDIQEFLEALVEQRNRLESDGKPDIELSIMDLFDSSDVVDLIGGFVLNAGDETVNDTLFNQDFENNPTQPENAVMKTEADAPGSIFSWKESSLVTAIRNGKWILLRGIESVNSGVLERLNGILEKEKVIWLNESLSEKLEDKMLIKHPNFRVFLEFNEDKSSKGPSRALRNRCIELRIDNFLLGKTPSEDGSKSPNKSATNTVADSEQHQYL